MLTPDKDLRERVREIVYCHYERENVLCLEDDCAHGRQVDELLDLIHSEKTKFFEEVLGATPQKVFDSSLDICTEPIESLNQFENIGWNECREAIISKAKSLGIG